MHQHCVHLVVFEFIHLSLVLRLSAVFMRHHQGQTRKERTELIEVLHDARSDETLERERERERES
jgi:hypothetical protein